MNIRVHIERLILDGLTVAPGQRLRLQAAVEAELTRLLAEGGVSPALLTGSALPSVPASGMTLSEGGDPTQLGNQIAQAVYGGIGGR